MRGAADDKHAAALEFDEEQHVEHLQPNRLHAEKVASQQAAGMGGQELAPRETPP